MQNPLDIFRRKKGSSGPGGSAPPAAQASRPAAAPIRKPQPARPPAPAPAPARTAPQPAAQAPRAPAPAAGTAVAVARTRPPAREVSADVLAFIADYRDPVPTAPGGPAEVSDAQAQYVVLLNNGWLLVSKSHATHHDVSSVRSILRRKGLTVRAEHLVEMDVIRRVYDRAAAANPAAARKRPADVADMQKTFMSLIERAAAIRASDIHLTVHRYSAQLEIRADGLLTRVDEMNAGRALELCQAAYAMAAQGEADSVYMPMEFQGARLSETSLQGLRFPEGVQSVRLQFNPLPAGGRYMIARLLYAQKIGSDSDVDELGYAPMQVKQIRLMRALPYGMNVISGPTGSGKSTTLQRSLTSLMRERTGKNVITIEDPPEYVIEGAKQLPVTNAATAEQRAEKFRQAITASLRSDPDVIMIGEIRDGASANLAVEAAKTGHGVWASLHTNDAISILDRLRDMGVEPYNLCDASVMTGLIGQRLARRTNPEIALTFSEGVAKGLLREDAVAFLEAHASPWLDAIRFANEAAVTNPLAAYKGRAVIAETILPNQDLLDLIRADNKPGAVRHWLESLDGLTLLEHAFVKMCRGELDPNEVEDKAGFLTKVDPARIPLLFALVDGAGPARLR